MSWRGRFLKLLGLKPWLYPIAYHLAYESEFLTSSELASRVGDVRTSLIRRALWYFKKIDALEILTGTPLKFRLKPDARKELYDIVSEDIITVKNKVFLIGRDDIYYYIVLRRRKIIARGVKKDIIESVYDILKRVKGGKFSIAELKAATNLAYREASLATKVLYMLGRVEKSNDGKYFISS